MSEMSNAELEGRLVGHRKLLALLVAEHARLGPDADGVIGGLLSSLTLELHAEDPGAVPAVGLAIQSASVVEVRQVLDLARDSLSPQKKNL